MVALRERYASARRESPVRGTGSIPGLLRVPYGDGWALAGDASMVMDPYSGQGIDQGAASAGFLAKDLNAFLTGEKEWWPAMKSYHQNRNEFSLQTFERTCKYSRDLRPMTEAALHRRGLGEAPSSH
jgi:flavin-dependent dehydrogenase